jgi:ABC-type sugar transport system ATPase subunit
LFDEPLSNLDARLRLTMRGEIKALQKRLGITSIYVTHDQVEAMTMADRIAVMSNGHLEAFDTPDGLYDRPKTHFIAGFVGNPPMNFTTVQLNRDNGTFIAANEDMRLTVPDERGEKAVGQAGSIILGIRPEDILVSDNGGVKGSVFVVEPLGREDMLDVRVGNQSFLVLVETEKRIRAGDTVSLNFDMQNVQFFAPDSGQSLLWN